MRNSSPGVPLGGLLFLALLFWLGSRGDSPKDQQHGKSVRNPLSRDADPETEGDNDLRAEFDGNDQQKTLRWLRKLAQPAYINDGNELAKHKRQQEIGAQIQTIVGKQIHWRFTITGVRGIAGPGNTTEASVSVQELTLSGKRRAVLRVEHLDKKPRRFIFGDLVTKKVEWASTLKAGDSIYVKGTIAAAKGSVIPDLGPPQITLKLSEYTLE